MLASHIADGHQNHAHIRFHVQMLHPTRNIAFTRIKKRVLYAAAIDPAEGGLLITGSASTLTATW